MELDPKDIDVIIDRWENTREIKRLELNADRFYFGNAVFRRHGANGNGYLRCKRCKPIAGNGDALYTIAQMAQAIELGITPDALPNDSKNVIAHFKNPAMPTVAETTDAAVKVSSQRLEFASTDTFLEMVGFDQADIRRIKAQEMRVRGQ